MYNHVRNKNSEVSSRVIRKFLKYRLYIIIYSIFFRLFLLYFEYRFFKITHFFYFFFAENFIFYDKIRSTRHLRVMRSNPAHQCFYFPSRKYFTIGHCSDRFKVNLLEILRHISMNEDAVQNKVIGPGSCSEKLFWLEKKTKTKIVLRARFKLPAFLNCPARLLFRNHM